MSGYGDTSGRGSGQTAGGQMDLAHFAKHVHLIVKFQALFRGHLARRNTAFIMKSKRVSLSQILKKALMGKYPEYQPFNS